MTEAAVEEQDPYQELCRGMTPGLLLTVNESDPTATPYGEMEVQTVDEETGTLYLSGHSDTYYRLHHESDRGTVIEELDEDDHGGRENVVTTIEVIGIAS